MSDLLRQLGWRIRAIFVPERPPVPVWALAGRGALFLVLAAYGWWFLVAPMRELGETAKFIHQVNLPFHEAGHVIFGVFGNRFVTVLGGTLGQLLMPAVLGIAFWWKRSDGFAAALALWWFGQNLVDCAPYINDARMLQLTLIGGSTGQEVEGHDWEYLLGELGWLRRDVHLARLVLRSGRALMVLGLAWAALVLWMEFRARRVAVSRGM